MKRLQVIAAVFTLCFFALFIIKDGFAAMREGANIAAFKELFQSADWKTEKHAPAIEAPDKVKKGETCEITVTVGKKISHPNTTEHHISWIEVYFLPEGQKFPVQLGRFEFTAHGASTEGPNTSTVYTNPEVKLRFKTDKPGALYAASYCNIHGLWQNSQSMRLE